MSALSLMMREDHEKQSALADGCIQVIVPPKVDDRTQIEHHRFDQQAEWFRVTMTSLTAQGEEPILQVSDRFKKLCNPGAQFSLGQYPSLVSFVGDTGVGKSTLVRAMNTVGIVEQMQSAGIMDWRHVFGCQLHGPVTRATSARKTTRPTSVGVHLYRDQTIVHVRDDHGNQEDVPILYADCEGFSAGSMRTDAELSVAPSSSRAPSVTSGSQASQSSRSRPNAESSTPSESAVAAGMDGPLQLDLVIKTPGFKEMGKTSADVFYARFLYAFSDVVVFVINEEQKMKREMQRLLEWAVSAVKTSRSRSSPRTLLVVRNGPRNHHDSFYDDIDLKDEMFHDFGDIWDDSRVLSEYKEDHDLKCILNEDKIYDNDQYFKLFFRETKICYIPSIQNGQPPDRIYQQYSLLRKLIVGGVQAAQKARSKSYFRHDVASAIDLIGQAFRHFAEFNEPFDFHLAARKDNPTPMSIPGHIANLLRHLGTTKEKFSKFEIIVAVCLVSYNYRTSRHGREPADIFDDELSKICRKGLEIYQRQFLRCSLLMGDGTECVNFVYNHDRHESKKGLIWSGLIDRSGFEKDVADVVGEVRTAFIDLYQELWDVRAQHGAPTLDATSAFRRRILGRERSSPNPPLARVPTLRSQDFDRVDPIWSNLKSNMTCFACLQYAPDHVLPCGHGYCEECVKGFGKILPQKCYHYVMDECVLCNATAAEWQAQQGTVTPNGLSAATRNGRDILPSLPPVLRLNPRCGGIRVLTLDGGGIRGVIELALIEKIEQRIGLNLPISEYFDLVVGTSTGGIIALAITNSPRDSSTSALTAKFISLAKRVFERDRFGDLWRMDPLKIVNKSTVSTIMMLLRVIKSRYKSSTLKASLLDFFDPKQPIFGGAVASHQQRTARVAVTSTSEGSPCLFTNYSRASYARGDVSDVEHLVDNRGFERQDNPEKEARVWEAAMATSAAPGYFHEWKIDDPENRKQGRVPFRDGALHSNLPVQCALEEQDRIWPAHKDYKKPLDILVALGTGKQLSETKIPRWLEFGGVGDVAAAYYKNVINTDAVWDAFVNSQRSNYSRARHFRLTIDLEEHVGLDEWDKMHSLYDKVGKLYDSSHKDPAGLWKSIDNVAYKLTASLLFFEPEKCDESVPTRGQGPRREQISGTILCRLQTPSPAMRTLIRRIDGFYHHAATRQVMTQLQLRDWKTAALQAEQNGQPFGIPCRLDNAEGAAVPQSLLVKLKPPAEAGEGSLWPISGFPITFQELKAGMLQRGMK